MLCKALAQSYTQYGEDVRNGAPVGPHERTVGQKPGFIPDGTGRKGKSVRTPKGGLKFVPEPMQNRPHPMPEPQVMTKAETRALVSESSLNAMGWYRDNETGKWVNTKTK